MKIGVFTYTFPHWKTQMGLLHLCLHGYKPDVIFAASPVKLDFYQSKIRINPKDLYLHDAKTICKWQKIKYYNTIHNSNETETLIKEHNLDIGIILGSRILKKQIIDAFSVGIINMHPGILPLNRGLDNVKWSIINNYPLGATAHLIDKHIDIGKLITQEEIKVYKDDVLVDFSIRILNLEQKLMIDSLDKIFAGEKEFETLDTGTYHKSVPPEIEKLLEEKLQIYKRKWACA